VPPIVAGAKQATVEHIKVHASSLEGNLEGPFFSKNLDFD
jgi:hypothetical protein